MRRHRLVTVLAARQSLIACVLIATWSLWLASSHLANGRESYYRQHDTAEAKGAFLVGQSAYAERNLLGQWSPVAGAGVDARVNMLGVQPLFEGIYRWAPYWWTTGVVVAAQTFIAAFFMVLLLRRRLGLTLVPALLAAFSYSLAYDGGTGAYSGFFLNWGLLFAGLPLLILALVRAAESRSPVAVAWGATIGIVFALAAYPIVGLLAVPPIAWWILVVEGRRTWRHVAVLVAFGASFAIMTAPVFVAMALHAPESHRSLWPTVGFRAGDDARWLVEKRVETQLWLRITGPMLLAALAGWLAAGWRTRPLNALMAIVAALLALQWFIVPVRAVLQHVAPAFASVQLDRMTQFLPFMAAAAGGLGLEQLRRFFTVRHGAARWAGLVVVWSVAALLAGVLAARSIAVNQDREKLRRYPSSYSGMLEQQTLVRLARQMHTESPARIVTFADRNQEYSGQHPGFAWAQGLETADGYLNLYSRQYHTFWSWVIKPTFELRPDLQQYFDEWGNMFYLFNAYNPYKAIPNPVPASAILNLKLLALVNVRYLVSPVAFDDPNLVPWPGNQGVATSDVQWTQTKSGASERALFVYENRLCLPRFFVTTRSRTFSHPDQLLAAMSGASVDELRHTAFLEDDEPATPGTGSDLSTRSTSDVTVVRYSADHIELDVRTDTPGILVVSNNYNRYWRAHVSNIPSSLMRVDFAFQGVRVPAGASRVRLQYDPPYGFSPWQCALAVAAITGLLTGGVWAVRRSSIPVRTRRHPPSWAVAGATGVLVGGGALLVLARPEAVSEPWVFGEAPHRLELRVRPTGLSTPTDFPILIERGPDHTDFWDVAPDTAEGIRFADRKGRAFAHEIERYDRLKRQLTAWVQVPKLGWGDQRIYMYLGESTMPTALASAAVWGRRYIAVWHMNEAEGDGMIVRDSTANRHEATLDAAMRGRWQTQGRIAGGLVLSGTDRLTVPASGVWAYGEDDWALELWLNPGPLERRNFGIVEHGPGGLFQFYLHSTNMLVFECRDAGQARDHSFANVGVESNTWSHVSLSRSGRRLMLQVNGVLKEAVDASADIGCSTASHPLTLGWGSYGGLDGRLDEIRISRGQRPPGWSRAVYLSQTGSLVNYGAMEQRRPVPAS